MLTVNVDDTTVGSTPDVTTTFYLALTNLDEVAPRITSGSTATAINENSGAGQVVYRVTSTDTGDMATGSTTYSLKSATGDVASFSINSNTGDVTLTGNPNYETKSSYSFTVIATDAANNQSEKVVTLGINNVNEAPTDLTLSANTIAENTVIGTGVKIGDITITDPDASGNNNVLTVSDTTNFEIRNGTELYFIGTSPDFETKPSYSINLKSTDVNGGNPLTYSKSFTIDVSNVNEAPIITSSQSFSLYENSKNATVVDTVNATDLENDSLSNWQIIGGNTNNGFTINADTGVITVANSTALDFETTPSFNLSVTVSDGTNTSIAQTVTINLKDVQEFTPMADNAIGTNDNDVVDLLPGNDSYNSGGGDDIVDGGDGDDSIFGGTGKDILDGGSGNDRLLGGDGNDTYIIDSIRDVVVENASEGQDTVKSVVNHTLTANVEDLILTGNSPITGTGNGLDNLITGNNGNNLLKGLGGKDILLGEGGNDTLIGGAGDDLLTGGEGADNFLFGSGAVFAMNAFGVDTITDFTQGSDKMALSKLSFNALSSAVGGNLQTSEFALISDDNLAGSSSAKIVYNPTTGNLFYNQNGVTDGLGSGGLFATLNGNLDANDILIQA